MKYDIVEIRLTVKSIKKYKTFGCPEIVLRNNKQMGYGKGWIKNVSNNEVKLCLDREILVIIIKIYALGYWILYA